MIQERRTRTRRRIEIPSTPTSPQQKEDTLVITIVVRITHQRQKYPQEEYKEEEEKISSW